jgi:hypothetical protein
MLSLSSSSAHDSQKHLPPPPPPPPPTTRDRAALASRRNEAEAKLRDRFLRFGTAVQCLGGGGGADTVREGASSTTDSWCRLGAANGASTSGVVENPAAQGASGADSDSRLDALRKRRSHLVESLSAAGGVAGATTTVAAAARDGTDSSASAPPTSASSDRKQRIEALRNRRRELEARTSQLLRGEGMGAGTSAQEHKRGDPTAASCATTATTSLSSSMSSTTTTTTTTTKTTTSTPDAPHDDSAVPKRARRELPGTAGGVRGASAGRNDGLLVRDLDLDRDLAAGTVVVVRGGGGAASAVWA